MTEERYETKVRAAGGANNWNWEVWDRQKKRRAKHGNVKGARHKAAQAAEDAAAKLRDKDGDEGDG